MNIFKIYLYILFFWLPCLGFPHIAVSQEQKEVLEKLWELKNCSMPESILVVPNHSYLYISNINGQNEAGYISKITRDGKIIEEKWVNGIDTPTGMGYYEGNIFVADQNKVHVIDITTGTIKNTLHSSATSLNDISITETGQVFISDLVTGSIYTIQNEKITLWLKIDTVNNLNGILVQGRQLIVGNVGSELSPNLAPEQFGSLFSINLAGKSVQLIPAAEKIGSIDGVVPFSDGVIISDPFAGKLFYATANEKRLLKQDIEGGIADIGIDNNSQTLFAPMLFGNSVVAYKIHSRQ